jgi:hypothetical protein
MKIAIDLHGVLEKYPAQFRSIFGVLKSLGAKIGVLSGPPREQIEYELRKLGFFPITDYFNFIESIVDFLQKDLDVKMWQDEKGNWWCDDGDWWSSKGRICLEKSIDVLIDDRTEYFEFFPAICETKFVHMKDCAFDHFILKFLDMLKETC